MDLWALREDTDLLERQDHRELPVLQEHQEASVPPVVQEQMDRKVRVALMARQA